MTDRKQYAPCPAGAAQLWSAHVDALDRHLSANKWALEAVAAVLITYPIVRIMIPVVLHSIVLPDVVRTVLKFI